MNSRIEIPGGTSGQVDVTVNKPEMTSRDQVEGVEIIKTPVMKTKTRIPASQPTGCMDVRVDATEAEIRKQ
jgi:hypothetical protein